MMLGAFDTAVLVPGRGLYVFAGDLVWRYGDGGRAPDQGFPRPITAEFPEPSRATSTPHWCTRTAGLHLFRGDQHIRYDIGAGGPSSVIRDRYAGDWPGVFPQTDRRGADMGAGHHLLLLRGPLHELLSPSGRGAPRVPEGHLRELAGARRRPGPGGAEPAG